MAILKIARMGHPVLLQRAATVPDPAAPEIRTLARDMVETMLDAGGVGLAAPQVHVPKRVIVFHPLTGPLTGLAGDGPEEVASPVVLVNPGFEPLDDEMELDMEGCLSIPGLRGAVPRHARIHYHGLTLEGERVEREAHGGLHARVVQHECDHLDGVLYPMRMTDLALFGFAEELDRYAGADAEAHSGADAETHSGK